MLETPITKTILDKIFYAYFLPNIAQQQFISYSYDLTTLWGYHHCSLKHALWSFGLTTKSAYSVGGFYVIPIIVKSNVDVSPSRLIIVKNKYQTFIFGAGIIVLPAGSTHSTVITHKCKNWDTVLANTMKLLRAHLKSPVSDILNHYDYLDLVVDNFAALLKDKNITNQLHSGFISAHGDKCYCLIHGKSWLTKGRLALLYLLTYTDVLDVPKHQYREWIKNNWIKYLPLIRQVEKQIGL